MLTAFNWCAIDRTIHTNSKIIYNAVIRKTIENNALKQQTIIQVHSIYGKSNEEMTITIASLYVNI